MGLKEGDVIALVAPNFPDTVLGFLGGLSGGLVITPINPYYTVGKLLYDIFRYFDSKSIHVRVIFKMEIKEESKLSVLLRYRYA